ncbi:MAG: NotI family restriction endonuclease [Chthoniobacteraceae bacterium]
MSLRVFELFGYAPENESAVAANYRKRSECPFVGEVCIKRFKSGLVSGVCSLKPAKSGPVICCPNRMYAGEYKVLIDVANDAFGDGMRLCRTIADAKGDGKDVVVFGKRWGKELRLPNRGTGGGYFVDWVLALINRERKLEGFVAVELQTMDTTGSYEAEVRAHLSGEPWEGYSKAGINWENVSKRILPQIIFKGHVLRNEPLCTKGMYFICPAPVNERIMTRLGNDLRNYHPHPGAITFRWYDLGESNAPDQPKELIFTGQMTTTVDQVALAFTSPKNLPSAGVYEAAIRAELESKKEKNSEA